MLLALLLSACASNSCADFVDAAYACTQDEAFDEVSICGEEWTAEAEDTFGEMYRCKAEAYRTADCSTTDGVRAAVNAAEECPTP